MWVLGPHTIPFSQFHYWSLSATVLVHFHVYLLRGFGKVTPLPLYLEYLPVSVFCSQDFQCKLLHPHMCISKDLFIRIFLQLSGVEGCVHITSSIFQQIPFIIIQLCMHLFNYLHQSMDCMLSKHWWSLVLERFRLRVLLEMLNQLRQKEEAQMEIPPDTYKLKRMSYRHRTPSSKSSFIP